MSLMEQFADPNTMPSLSFGEKMLGSTITMLMGIGITFLVLCILWAFISIMGRAMKVSGGKKAAPAAAAPAPAPAAATEAPVSDDADVIAAVIAAAVAAYEGDGVTTNLVVRKIVRVPSGTTLWTNAARNEQIDSRRF